MNLQALLCVASALIATVVSSGTTCYYKGGEQTSSDSSFTPCNPTNTQTHCCDAGQTCVSNGLCFVKWDSSLNTGACTDSTWEDSSCFQQCGAFSTLYRCSNNNWCCSNGGNTTNCCNDSGVSLFTITGQALIQNGTAFVSGYNIAPVADIVSSTSTATSTSASGTSSPTSSSGSQSATSPTSTSTSNSDSGALAAGLGAGLGVGIPLAIAVGALTYLLMRERKKNKALQQGFGTEPKTPAPAYQDHGFYSKSQHVPHTTAHMLQTQDPRNELPEHGSRAGVQELQ